MKEDQITGERLAFIHAASLVRQYRTLYHVARNWAIFLSIADAVLIVLLVLLHG